MVKWRTGRVWVLGLLVGVVTVAGCSAQPGPSPSPSGSPLNETAAPPAGPPDVVVAGSQATLLSSTWVDSTTGETTHDDPAGGVSATDLVQINWSEILDVTVGSPVRPALLSVQSFTSIKDGIPGDGSDPVDCLAASNPCGMSLSEGALTLSLRSPATTVVIVLTVMYALPSGSEGSAGGAMDSAAYGVRLIQL